MVELAADVIIPNEEEKILMLKRNIYPFKGKWVLPGGHLEKDEKIEQTAKREAKEETNLEIDVKKLLEIYSDPDRDPRGRYISAAYIAERINTEKRDIDVETNQEATEAQWKDPSKVKREETGFDHWKMIQDYKRKFRDNTKKQKHIKTCKNKTKIDAEKQ